MSFRYKGGVISATAPTTSTVAASGIWTTTQQLQAKAAGNWPPSSYQISRSLRFNSADSAYLSRTPGSASNLKTWTWSGWVKRSGLGITAPLFGYISSGAGNNQHYIRFNTSDQIDFAKYTSGYTARLVTTQVFRDVSAWYHIVAVWDTSNATAGDRMRLYVNGQEITAFGTDTNPSLNLDGYINDALQTGIGTYTPYNTDFFSGYLTNVYLIDGQALTPSSFGAYDSYGVWSPTSYTGTYGTNGFYVNFSDNSNTTAATLGKDYSGNGNNYTPTNFSVTAGIGNDSFVDTPTNYGSDTGVGGEVRGNYAVLNQIYKESGTTISDGNLYVVGVNSGGQATIAPPSGKFYWEFTLISPYTGGGYDFWGIHGVSSASSFGAIDSNFSGVYCNTSAANNPGVYQQGTRVTTASTWANNDIVGFAFDADNNTLAVYRNGTQVGSTVTVAATSRTIVFSLNGVSGNAATAAYNFGQRAFAYTAPSGFKALCAQNLPSPTISNGASYMAATLYTGNGSTQSIANTVNSASFQPDLVWMKSRSAVGTSVVSDSTRGVTKQLFSNTNDVEQTDSDAITSFDSTGFALGNGALTIGSANTNTTTYVGWQWKANGGTTVSNTSGSITSTVQANNTSGFSIVTYTGTGANATIGHGLTVAPKFVVTKSRTFVGGHWNVYHASVGNTAALLMNLDYAAVTSSTYWNNTSPTTSVFSVGTDGSGNNSGSTFVAYCFSEIVGFSKIGSYTGNGSADGPFVYCGFRPRFVMIKNAYSAGNNWLMYDSARSTYNVMSTVLIANGSAAETASSTDWYLDAISNGFKVRTSYGQANTNASTYIFIAFAENPFNYSRAR